MQMAQQRDAIGIEFSGVTRTLGDLLVLRGASWSVPSGSVGVLFGGNGAGKTTLLRVLATLMRPEEGAIAVNGVDALRSPIVVRGQIGFVAHGSLMSPELTGYENLSIAAALAGHSDPKGRARELLAEFGLARWADEPIRTYSRGMQQRASIARAVVHEPTVMLLDEPFTGLDVAAEAELRTHIAGWRASGRAVLLVTHRVPMGIEIADRTAILERGRIVEPPDDMAADPATLEAHYGERLATATAPPIASAW